MFRETLGNMGLSLYDPSRVFTGENYSRSSIKVIVLLYFLFSLVTGLASFRVTGFDGVRDFQVELGLREAVKMMPGATPEQEDELREQIRQQMYNPVTKISSLISAVIGSLLSVLAALLLFWLYMLVIARFIGGEEEPVTIMKRKGEKIKKHRNSFLLSAYRYSPLILAGFISMLLLLAKKPESFYNIASLEELTEKMAVNLSFFDLLYRGEAPLMVKTILNIVTNPFWWWSGWIGVTGMKEVWRLPLKKGIILFLIWVILVVLFQWAVLLFTLRFGR